VNPFDPNYKSQIPTPTDGRRRGNKRGGPPSAQTKRHMDNLLPRKDHLPPPKEK
jgi:hypothetical protein